MQITAGDVVSMRVRARSQSGYGPFSVSLSAVFEGMFPLFLKHKLVLTIFFL